MWFAPVVPSYASDGLTGRMAPQRRRANVSCVSRRGCSNGIASLHLPRGKWISLRPKPGCRPARHLVHAFQAVAMNLLATLRLNVLCRTDHLPRGKWLPPSSCLAFRIAMWYRENGASTLKRRSPDCLLNVVCMRGEPYVGTALGPGLSKELCCTSEGLHR